ncbi:MAG: PKD domain-containing protein [Bacteroidota bacterium]
MRTFLFTGLIVLFACLTAWTPLLAQTADITSGCAPLSVNFTAPGGLSDHFWDFQNGANSNDVNPSAIFTDAGTFEVSLREGNGGPLVGTVTITVFPRPELNFTVDTTEGCAPLLINFTDASTVDPGITITNYSWVFGDGGSSSATNPSYTYATPGIYDVSLSITTNQEGCDETTVFDDVISVGGIDGLNFITNPNPAVACEPPLTVFFANFTPTDGVTFSWEFGNGSTFDGPTPPPITYTESGDFTVTLTGMDSLGCTRERTRPVTILDTDLSGIPDTVCFETRVYYESWVNADSVRYDWPSTAITGMDEFGFPFVIFTQEGPQLVDVFARTDSPIQCSVDSMVMIFVDRVFAEVEADPTFTCNNELTVDYTATSTTMATFEWLFFETETGATGPTATNTYEYVDTLEYSMNGLNEYLTLLIATNPSGCWDTIFHFDTIFAPNALFMPDVVNGCAPLTVTFADSSASFEPILSYTYTYGDGNTATFTNDDPHSYTFDEPGTYEVVLNIENAAGCVDTSYARVIEVGAPLDFDFTYDESVLCVDDTIQFTINDPPPEIDWVQFEEPDTLYVLYNGCLSQSINSDIIIQGPDVELSYEIDCEEPFTVDFTAEVFDATSVLWEFGDGATSNEINPSHTYSVTGDFWAKVTAFNTGSGCPDQVDSTLICIRDLQAAFEMPEIACSGEQVSLDASATVDVNGEFCAYGFTWFFENNSRPIMGNDTILPFAFSSPGQDIVTLVAKDINGCTDTVSQVIDVYQIEPDFEVDDSFICMPSTVNFTDLSVADTTLVSWSWDFGDGNMDDTPLETTHTYTDVPPGADLPVVLTLEDAAGCITTDTLLIQTYVPVSNILADVSPLNVCIGDTINFTATQFTEGGSSLTFTWDFGTETVDGPEATQDYPIAGSYPITLSYVEIATGCSSTTEATVNVQNFPTAGFSSSVDDAEIICAPTQIAFTDESIADGNLNYDWDFGNGSFSNAANPVGTFERGTYTVTMIASTTFGCSDTTSASYELVGPVGDFNFGPQEICQGEAVTFELIDTSDVTSFSWDLGDGTVISDVNPLTHIYADVPVLGNRPVVLTLRGADDACEISVTKNLLIRDVRAEFSLGDGTDTLLCVGEFTLNNESVGADAFTWTLPDGTNSNDFEPNFFSETGTYEITLAVADSDAGCVDTLTRTFSFAIPTGIDAVGEAICPGDTAQLTINGVEDNWTFQWQNSPEIISPLDLRTVEANPSMTSTFFVTVTDTIGCEVTDSATVVVIEAFPYEDVDATACPGDELAIPLPEPDSNFIVTWTPAQPPQVVGEENIDATVEITDVAGCFEDSYNFFVLVVSDSIVVPDIFSPNGDGVNDEFRIFSTIDQTREDLIRIDEFSVYNRWGQRVFESSGPSAIWDGMYNDKAAPADSYLYRILLEVTACQGGPQEFSGQLMLVR